jgi:hypothetical protein
LRTTLTRSSLINYQRSYGQTHHTLLSLLFVRQVSLPISTSKSMNIQVHISLQSYSRHSRSHTPLVIDSHPEIAPSLRIDKPFPALLEHSQNLNLDALDDTDHGHVPYIYILVKVMEQWKAAVGFVCASPSLSKLKMRYSTMVNYQRQNQRRKSFRIPSSR